LTEAVVHPEAAAAFRAQSTLVSMHDVEELDERTAEHNNAWGM